MDTGLISAVVERWRGAMISRRGMTEEVPSEFEASDEFSPLQSALARKPVAAPLAPAAAPDSFFFPVDPPNGRTPRLRR